MESRADQSFSVHPSSSRVKDLDPLLCLKIMPCRIAATNLGRQVSCLSTILIPACRLEDTDSRIASDFTAVSVGADSPVTNLSKKGASLRSRTMRPRHYFGKPGHLITRDCPDSFCDAVQSRYVNECDLSYRYAFWLV